MAFNFIQGLSLAAISQSGLMSIHFFRLKRGDRVLNRILAIFLVTFVLLMFASLAVTAGVERFFIPYHKPIFFLRQLAFLTGPLLYFFVRRSLDPNYELKRYHASHFVPFIGAILFYFIKLVQIPYFVIWQSSIRLPNTSLILVHNFIYFIISTVLLKKTHFQLQNNGNGESRSKLVWVLLLTCGTVMIWLIELNSLIVLFVFRYVRFCPHMASLYSACVFIFCNSIAYFVISKPELFIKSKRYEKSRLSRFEKEAYKNKLLTCMEEQKPYLNPNLTMTDLADELAVPHRELSQIINESFEQHFYDFINSYRIKESKQFLRNSSKKSTVLEIAYAVGFNSKSTFNTAFKKHVGVSPTEFKNLS